MWPVSRHAPRWMGGEGRGPEGSLQPEEVSDEELQRRRQLLHTGKRATISWEGESVEVGAPDEIPTPADEAPKQES